MGNGRTVGDGAWSTHLGRASYVVPTDAGPVARIAADGHALNRIVLPHLDEQASALSARAPRWVLPPTHGDVRAGFVALVTVDQSSRAPKVLLRSEQVPEAVPTRVALDLDLEEDGFRTRVVARWDVGIHVPLPGVAARALQPLLGTAVERLVRALVDGLATAADRALADGDVPTLPDRDAPSATRPRALRVVASSTPGRSLVPVPVPALEPDEALEALLDEVIGVA